MFLFNAVKKFFPEKTNLINSSCFLLFPTFQREKIITGLKTIFFFLLLFFSFYLCGFLNFFFFFVGVHRGRMREKRMMKIN